MKDFKPVYKIQLDELELKRQKVQTLLAELKTECDKLGALVLEAIQYPQPPDA